MKAYNDPRQIQLRRCEYNLANSGVALIAFGVWELLRAVFYTILQDVDVTVFIGPQEVNRLVAELGDTAFFLMKAVFLFVIVFFLLINLLLRWLIGRAAVKDAQGKKKSPVYIAASALLGVGMFIPYIRILIGAANEVTESTALMNKISSSVFIDLTSGFILLLLVIYAIRTRRLRKQLKEATDVLLGDDEIFGQSEMI